MNKVFIILLSAIFIISCSDDTLSNSSNVLDSKVDKKILWEVGGRLPAQTGMDKNIGTAGLLYGSLANKYIVVGIC